MFVKASTFGVKKYEDTKLKAPAVTHTRTTVKGTFGVKKDEDTCSSLKVIKDNKSTKKNKIKNDKNIKRNTIIF